MPWRLRRRTRTSRSRNPIDHLRVEVSVLSNGLRNVVVVFVMLGLLATACTEESRDQIREALPSGVSGLPSVLPSPRPTGPTTGAVRGTDRTDRADRVRGTDRTDRVDRSGRKPHRGAHGVTDRVARRTDRGTGARTGRVDPGDHPHPRGTRRTTAAHRAAVTDRDPIARGDHRSRRRDRHGTDRGSHRCGHRTDRADGCAGSAEGDASADVVQAAASSTTESSAWVLLLFLAVLGGVIGYLWWRARRGRNHHG